MRNTQMYASVDLHSHQLMHIQLLRGAAAGSKYNYIRTVKISAVKCYMGGET